MGFEPTTSEYHLTIRSPTAIHCATEPADMWETEKNKEQKPLGDAEISNNVGTMNHVPSIAG